MLKRRLLGMTGLVGLAGLTGCFSSVRHVQRVQQQAPGTYRTADVEELEKLLADRDAAVKTLQASVMLKATTGGEQTGKEKTYVSFRGFIFLQKPRDLRVIMQAPLIGTRALDMVSDGNTFTLLIPPRSKAYVGTDAVTKPTAKGLESLRPSVFLDSLLVPGISGDEQVLRTESQRIVTEAHGRKPAIEEPDYELEIVKPRGGHALQRERVIHISRETLLPYQQDVYDNEGQIVTTTTYDNYLPAEPNRMPVARTITISRPLDQYSLEIDITKVALNVHFESDQFEQPKIPPGFKVQRME